MLQLDKELGLTTGTIRTMCSDGNYLYVGTDVPEYRQYDWNTNQINTAVALSTTPTSMIMLGTASAVIFYGSARVSYIAVNSNTKTDVTTNALATFASQAGQQSASDLVNNIAISTTSTTGKVLKVNTTFTLTQLSPSAISASTASCVIFRSDTSTFILGTSAGKVFEMDSSGNVLKNISLINTPNITAPTIVVTGLSYYNDILAVATAHGLLYFYQYSTGTLLYTLPCNSRSSSAPATSCLSDSASGTFLLCSSGQSPNSTAALTEIYFSKNLPIVQPLYNDTIADFQAAKIETTLNKIWAFTPNAATSGAQARIFTISPVQITVESTRSQDPLGVDIADRIIRIRDLGIGSATIEIDTNVSAGSQSLNCTNDAQYIELAIKSGSPDRWDVREFRA